MMGATIMDQIDMAGLITSLVGLRQGLNNHKDSVLEGAARVCVLKEGEKVFSSRAKQVLLVMWGKIKVTQGDEVRSLIEGDHFTVEPGEYKVQCSKKSCVLAAEFSPESWDLLCG